MATIYVENVPFQADPKRNLLDVCLSLGFNLPYFCWHPAMGSVGACRQCAVKQFKDEEDQRGKIVMACMTPATEGTRISIQDPDAVLFRKLVIEGLMTSHPHDCPVCDEGGECHLQDMTVMTGHDYRRYRFKKRTFRNQYLGPFVNHEMNRCIQCYRCVRFYREYAGGHDLNAFVINRLVYFGRHADGRLESEFSGNLVEVCPTGVFTDATLKQHYTRKWDLQFAPSVCVHCGAGCNVSPGERYGTLRRIVNRFNRDVNGYFLCDRGRYGYEFVNSPRRVRAPLRRGEPIAAQEAVSHLSGLVSEAPGAIGIGSPRASIEANFALRTLVGADRFYAGIGAEEHRLLLLMVELLRQGPARTPSLWDLERSDAVLVLGEDVLNTAPRVALALRQSVRQEPFRAAEKLRIPLWMDHSVRQAVQDARGPLFLATPNATGLDDIAAAAWRAAPDEIARLGFAVAHALDPSAPDASGLPEPARALAGQIAQALQTAERPAVIAGPSLSSEAILRAASNIARALSAGGRTAALSFIAPEVNSIGLALMGASALDEAFEAMEHGEAGAAIVLENDLYRRAPASVVDRFFESARRVVALDSLLNRTTEKAELVLPAGTFAESDGTFVNQEGRAQRFFQVFVPGGDIQESWRWLRDAMTSAGRKEVAGWRGLDDVTAAVAHTIPALARIPEAAPPEKFRLAGEKVPREPHRYSGRTAMLAHISVHEPKPPVDPDAPLSFSMEGYPAQPPASLVPFFWSPGWNSIQAVNKFQEEINGPLRAGPAGVRLIEPPAGRDGSYSGEAPPPFAPRDSEWLVVPLPQIFGSDELSAEAPAVASLAAKPYVTLNLADAERLGVRAGEEVELHLGGLLRHRIGGSVHRLPVKIEPALAVGLAGVPAGILSTLQGFSLPAWARITRV